LVERWFPKSDVVGSNPTGRESKIKLAEATPPPARSSGAARIQVLQQLIRAGDSAAKKDSEILCSRAAVGLLRRTKRNGYVSAWYETETLQGPVRQGLRQPQIQAEPSLQSSPSPEGRHSSPSPSPLIGIALSFGEGYAPF
jgi:hypothetical protein